MSGGNPRYIDLGMSRCPRADSVIEQRGKPGMIVSDKGTELTSDAMLACSREHKVEWHHHAPGKPMIMATLSP